MKTTPSTLPYPHPPPPPRLKQVPRLYSWYFSLLTIIILLLLFLKKLIQLSLSVLDLSKILELQRSSDCTIHHYTHVFQPVSGTYQELNKHLLPEVFLPNTPPHPSPAGLSTREHWGFLTGVSGNLCANKCVGFSVLFFFSLLLLTLQRVTGANIEMTIMSPCFKKIASVLRRAMEETRRPGTKVESE